MTARVHVKGRSTCAPTSEIAHSAPHLGALVWRKCLPVRADERSTLPRIATVLGFHAVASDSSISSSTRPWRWWRKRTSGLGFANHFLEMRLVGVADGIVTFSSARRGERRDRERSRERRGLVWQ